MGVCGYSYGGFMTSWIIGHNDRFKATVVGAPCTDLYSMYGTSDIGVSFGEDQWGGSLVDSAEKLIKHSPITYASKVSTRCCCTERPTLGVRWLKAKSTSWS